METAYPENEAEFDEGMIGCKPKCASPSNDCIMFSFQRTTTYLQFLPLAYKTSDVVLNARSAERYAFIMIAYCEN